MCTVSRVQPVCFVPAWFLRWLNIYELIIIYQRNWLTCLRSTVVIMSPHFGHAAGSFFISSQTAATRTRAHKFHWARFYLFNICFTYLLVDVSYLRIDIDSFNVGVYELQVFYCFRVATCSSLSEFAKSVDMIIHFLHPFFSWL